MYLKDISKTKLSVREWKTLQTTFIIKNKMTKIQLDLSKEESKKVEIHKIIWDFPDKKESIKHMIQEYKEWKVEDEQ